MSPIGCSLLALACAALFVCARAEDLPETNPACSELTIGNTEPKYTNAKTFWKHVKGPETTVTVKDEIFDHLGHWLVGIKYVACDFFSGKKPSITRTGSALTVKLSCDKAPPRCRAGLDLQVIQYGMEQLNAGPFFE